MRARRLGNGLRTAASPAPLPMFVLGGFLAVSVPCFAGAPGTPEGEVRALPPAATAVLLEQIAARVDSCRVTWAEPFYYLWEWAQQRCEATQCQLTESREIAAVSVVLYNYGSQPAEKGLRVFLLADAGGLPGATLWSVTTTTTLLPAGETREVVFTVDPPVGPIGPGAVWLGHEELQPGPPSSLFDEVADGTAASSTPPCGNWTVQELGDYLQFLPVGDPGAVREPADAFVSATGVRWRNLHQPARGGIGVEMELSRPQTVTLGLYSLGGRAVETLIDRETLASGIVRRTFAADRLPSGLYWLRLEADGARDARKVLLLH